MCGICGIAYKDGLRVPEEGLLRSMNDCLVHRGPDDQGYHLEPGVGLAMRRLSIIDLNTGHQPISNEDGSLHVILNGEIYNFLELKPDLEKKGHRFKTKSDTEVILHLYEEYGTDCLKHLRGMFAFALWDQKRSRLFLARDRIGKKPMIYTLQKSFLAFASELRALLKLPEVSREMDPQALDLYLSLQYIPSPKTVFSSISKLPPAHYLIYEKGQVKIERYWDLPLEAKPSTLDPLEAQEMIREKLKEAVRLRMIADVPLGAFLSGGIDSSCVVALMSRLSERPVKTFSIGFQEQDFSELQYAKLVAERYGCDHKEIVVTPQMAEVLPKLAWHYSEPYADASALPSYYVAQATRQHVTVALNGDGGDENFAGYERYVGMQAAGIWDRLPSAIQRAILAGLPYLPEKTAPVHVFWKLKRFLASVSSKDLPSRHLKMVNYFSEEEKSGLYTKEFQSRLKDSLGAYRYLAESFKEDSALDEVNRLLYADFKTYLPECLMVKMDIASMANSLETRSPFLDHEFVELVFSLPGDWKLRGRTSLQWAFKNFSGSKWILKQAFKDWLPPRIYRRGKQGFGIPLGPWFKGPLKKYWEDHVLSPQALSRNYFRPEGLNALWKEHQEGRRDHGYRLWALLMLELWHETYAP